MRGEREGWFKECKIDTVKVKLCRVPVVTVACGRSQKFVGSVISWWLAVFILFYLPFPPSLPLPLVFSPPFRCE